MNVLNGYSNLGILIVQLVYVFNYGKILILHSNHKLHQLIYSKVIQDNN